MGDPIQSAGWEASRRWERMTKLRLLPLVLVLLVAALFAPAAQADEGDAPLLSFSPAPLELGKATVGTETGAAAVDVANVSGAGLAVDSVQLSGADAADFKLTGGDCGWLAAEQHCTVWVAFMPGSTGVKEAALLVAPKEAAAQVLPVTGTALAPQLTISPGGYDFGIVPTNQPASTWLQLTNSGEAFLLLGSVSTGGRDSGNFWTSGGDCWGGRRLEPGESCSQQVSFNAWDPVSYEAELRAEANGASFAATLTGTGGRPRLQAASDPVEVGSAAVGGDPVTRTIVLTNEGNIAGGYFIALIAGGDIGSFQIVSEDCTGRPIAPGGTCAAEVRFDPQKAGQRIARLAFFGEGDGATMVTLRGEGIEPPQPGGTPSSAPTPRVGGDGAQPVEPAPRPARKRARHRRFSRGASIGIAPLTRPAVRAGVAPR